MLFDLNHRMYLLTKICWKISITLYPRDQGQTHLLYSIFPIFALEDRWRCCLSYCMTKTVFKMIFQTSTAVVSLYRHFDVLHTVVTVGQRFSLPEND